jgi:hypothetical protein
MKIEIRCLRLDVSSSRRKQLKGDIESPEVAMTSQIAEIICTIIMNSLRHTVKLLMLQIPFLHFHDTQLLYMYMYQVYKNVLIKIIHTNLHNQRQKKDKLTAMK